MYPYTIHILRIFNIRRSIHDTYIKEETDGTADVEIVTTFFEQNLPVKPALAAD